MDYDTIKKEAAAICKPNFNLKFTAIPPLGQLRDNAVTDSPQDHSKVILNSN